MIKKVFLLLVGFASLSLANDFSLFQEPSIRPSLSETQINNSLIIPEKFFSQGREIPLNQTIESMLLMVVVANCLLITEIPSFPDALTTQGLQMSHQTFKKKDVYKKNFHFQPRKKFSAKHLKQYSSTPHFQRKQGRYRASDKK
jgi:hypothetical protein